MAYSNSQTLSSVSFSPGLLSPVGMLIDMVAAAAVLLATFSPGLLSPVGMLIDMVAAAAALLATVTSG